MGSSEAGESARRLALARDLFKVGGPVFPEARLIGREGVVKRLAFVVLGQGTPTWLIGVRRIGKTSLALAVVERHRDAGGWALHVDLSAGISNSAVLADRLAEQARAAGIKASGERAAAARKKVKLSSDLIKRAARVLGLPAELVDAAEIAAQVDAALGPVEDPARRSLHEVLAALEAASVLAEQPIVLFVDEIQRVRNYKQRGQRRKEWDDQQDGLVVQQALASVMHGTSAVTIMLAGSDGDAIAELREEGMPLHHDGVDFDVPQIGDEDWVTGITQRFAEVGIPIARERILEVLDASRRHSQRTMSVFHQLHQIAEMNRDPELQAGGDPGELIDARAVAEAIARARRHPSWKD